VKQKEDAMSILKLEQVIQQRRVLDGFWRQRALLEMKRTDMGILKSIKVKEVANFQWKLPSIYLSDLSIMPAFGDRLSYLRVYSNSISNQELTKLWPSHLDRGSRE
jgi:hypothetical protein